ncbi:hypothetical protein Glove_26g304 [Diversispora epigaea]|uniref:Uncharacterized protein n=1 Tax=Diversispora epigaea TaxID=1348612 RepID=A0A397JKH6_9GLOM|nr:hypothetical protein Glove_26g304 [Diversispora epigaea]
MISNVDTAFLASLAVMISQIASLTKEYLANVHTLQNIKGHRLGSMREQELEESLHRCLKSISELNDSNGVMQSKCLKQMKGFDRERKGWNRERKQWESVFDNVNSEKQKLHTHTLELIGETKRLKIENTNLTSKNICKDRSLAESNAENVIKSKKIRSLESMIKILEGKLTSAQKDVFSIQNESLKKDSEILSLKSKIAEVEQMKSALALKVSELEHLKSEDISLSVIGGDNEKNTQSEEQSSISKSNNSEASVSPLRPASAETHISADNNLSKYFARHRLGSMREQELEESLHRCLKSISELNDSNGVMQSKCLKQMKGFDRERKGWNRERKQWESVFDNVNSEKQKLHTHTLELIGETKRLKIENTNLTSKNICKDRSLAESNAENVIKSKKIRSLESMIKILEGKLTSAQKDVFSIQNESLKKDSEILSLKSKIAEVEQMKSALALKVSELEHLKSEDISLSVIGGDNEKNTQSEEQSSISKSNNSEASVSPLRPASAETHISADNNLSKYFARKKNMDQDNRVDARTSEGQSPIVPIIKIDTIMPDHTDDEITPIPEESVIRSYAPLPEVDTEIIPKVSDDKTNKDRDKVPLQNNNIPPEPKSHPQISVGGIEAIPIVASSLMSPLSAYMFFTLLIIAMMWFVILRRTWGLGRSSDQLRDYLFELGYYLYNTTFWQKFFRAISLKKDSEILSLKSKIAEVEQMKSALALKVSELEHLKSEDISLSVIGGDNEKNTQSEEQTP